MYFELDGVNFNIYAQDGKVTHDTYYEAKAEKYIRENFLDGFMNEKGISPVISISFMHNSANYGKIRDDTLDDIYTFKDSIWVTVTQDHIDGISSPRMSGGFMTFINIGWTIVI